MFNLVNFCKFFASKKIITTGSRASVGTMKRTADDRVYFSILGQKIELVYDGAEWQPATPDLFGQEQEQEEQEQEEQEQEEQEQEEQEQKNFCRMIEISEKIEVVSAKCSEESNFSVQTNFNQKMDALFSSIVTNGFYKENIQAKIGGELYSFVIKKFRQKGDLRLFVFVYKNSDGTFVGLVKCKNPIHRGIEVPDNGYYFEQDIHFTKQERSIEKFLTCISKSQKAILTCISNKTYGKHDIDVSFQSTLGKFVPIKEKLVKLGKELTCYKGAGWRVLFENGSSYEFLRAWYNVDREHNIKYCTFTIKDIIDTIVGTLENNNPTNIRFDKWNPDFDEAFNNGFYFLPILEQEEPTPAPELEQEELTPAPELEQEEPTPAPELEQEEPTSPIYRYFETQEGSSIGVYKAGDDTFIGIADKAGNLWSWRNLGRQGKKRVKYTIIGDDQQLNSKEIGSIHGAIIEARNFLQAAKKAKKSAKAEIKAAFLGQEPVKIAEIQLNNAGFYKLTVLTSAGEAIVPKTEPKEEEVPILAIDPVFNEKTEGISAKITKLRELKEQTRLILEQLKAEGLSIEQIKALLGN